MEKLTAEHKPEEQSGGLVRESKPVGEADECEGDGVLDPMAWKDRSQWNGHVEQKDTVNVSCFTTEKALGEGVGFKTKPAADQNLVIKQNLCTDSVAGKVSGSGRADGGKDQRRRSQGGGSRLSLEEIIKNISSLIWREHRGDKGDQEKRVSDTVEQRERERQQGWALAGEPAGLLGRSTDSPSQSLPTSWQMDERCPGRCLAENGNGELVQIPDSEKMVKCASGHRDRNARANAAEEEEIQVGGLGRGLGGAGGSGSWALGNEENEDEDEAEMVEAEDSDDARRCERKARIGGSLQRTGEAIEEAERMERERMVFLMRGMMMARHLHTDQIPAEVEKGLFVGSVGASHNRQELLKRGITHVLTVANSLPPPFPGLFKYTLINVLDSPAVDLASRFTECFAVIDEARNNGGAILVHCFAGRSRSVTVVLAYLMKSRGLPLDDALDKVRKVRPEANPNSGFMQQLREFQQKLEKEGIIASRSNRETRR